MPQAICLFWLPRAVDFKVSCSQILRRAFAGIRTHDPLVESILTIRPRRSGSCSCHTYRTGTYFQGTKKRPDNTLCTVQYNTTMHECCIHWHSHCISWAVGMALAEPDSLHAYCTELLAERSKNFLHVLANLLSVDNSC
jgi:hypothetical protein